MITTHWWAEGLFSREGEGCRVKSLGFDLWEVEDLEGCGQRRGRGLTQVLMGAL